MTKEEERLQEDQAAQGKLEALGALSIGAAMGHRAGGLQRRWNRLGLSAP